MALSGIILLFFILWLMIWRRRNLRLLEILAVWLFESSMSVNIENILFANLQWLKQTHTLQMFFSSFFFRTFLVPTCWVLFIDYYAGARTIVRRFVLIAAFIVGMSALEYGAAWVKMFQFVKWSLWYSIGEWLLVLICALVSRGLYYYFLTKGRTAG